MVSNNPFDSLPLYQYNDGFDCWECNVLACGIGENTGLLLVHDIEYDETQWFPKSVIKNNYLILEG